MNTSDLKQGERRIVNGKERVYHGRFNCGTILDFVRQIDEQTIEYCSFVGVTANQRGELTGRAVSKYKAKPLSSPEFAGDESIDLFARGRSILNTNKKRTD